MIKQISLANTTINTCTITKWWCLLRGPCLSSNSNICLNISKTSPWECTSQDMACHSSTWTHTWVADKWAAWLAWHNNNICLKQPSCNRCDKIKCMLNNNSIKKDANNNNTKKKNEDQVKLKLKRKKINKSNKKKMKINDWKRRNVNRNKNRRSNSKRDRAIQIWSGKYRAKLKERRSLSAKMGWLRLMKDMMWKNVLEVEHTAMFSQLKTRKLGSRWPSRESTRPLKMSSTLSEFWEKSKF